MYNQDVYDQVCSFKEEVNEKLKNNDLIQFKLEDINFDESINVKGNIVEPRALSKVFKVLRVQNDFFDKYEKTLDKDSWNEIRENLKNVNKNTEFWGRKVSGERNSKITELFQKFEILNENSLSTTYNQYFDLLLLALKGSTQKLVIKDLNYIDEKSHVVMRFLNKEGGIDVFKNDKDIWKTGVDINWNPFQFINAPFFERLICSNGVSVPYQGYQAKIQNKKFNLERIQKELNKTIIKNSSFDEIIQNKCKHLADNNVSLQEFYKFQNFFKSRNNDDVDYEHILNRIFSEKEIYRNYGEKIEDKSNKWKSTANSGRNAYDFFNDLTWLASHSKDVRLDESDALQLQIETGNFLMKDILDLEDVAPNVNFHVNKKIEN